MRRRYNRARSRGAVLVEYALLLTAFFIPAAMGIVAGGASMLREYKSARETLLKANP